MKDRGAVSATVMLGDLTGIAAGSSVCICERWYRRYQRAMSGIIRRTPIAGYSRSVFIKFSFAHVHPAARTLNKEGLGFLDPQCVSRETGHRFLLVFINIEHA